MLVVGFLLHMKIVYQTDTGFSEEDTKKIIKIQALTRGRLARKKLGSTGAHKKKKLKLSASSKVKRSDTVLSKGSPQDKTFTKDEEKKIVKIQALHRGRSSRKLKKKN